MDIAALEVIGKAGDIAGVKAAKIFGGGDGAQSVTKTSLNIAEHEGMKLIKSKQKTNDQIKLL